MHCIKCRWHMECDIPETLPNQWTHRDIIDCDEFEQLVMDDKLNHDLAVMIEYENEVLRNTLSVGLTIPINPFNKEK